MKFRFISFRTYGTEVEQFDSKAFMSEDIKALTKAVLGEVEALRACGHDHIVVHETCDASTCKKWYITFYKV
jgi:hypothetical protein